MRTGKADVDMNLVIFPMQLRDPRFDEDKTTVTCYLYVTPIQVISSSSMKQVSPCYLNLPYEYAHLTSRSDMVG